MWFLNDGAPIHYTRFTHNHTNNNFRAKWIDKGRPIAWTP